MTKFKTMKILIRKDGHMFKEVDFAEESIILGRSKEADIQLFDEDVSRKHTKIFRKGDKTFIEDLQSKNGTIFNGKTIQKLQISPGDTFFIGPFNISVEDIMPSEQRTTVEYNIKSEAETRVFHETSKNTNTGSKIKEVLEKAKKEKETDEQFDSDSFLNAISVAPETSTPSFSVTSEEIFENEISARIKESKMTSYPKLEPEKPAKKTKSPKKPTPRQEISENSGPSFSVGDDEIFEESDLAEVNDKTIANMEDEPEKKSARTMQRAPNSEKTIAEKLESGTELRKDFPSAAEKQEELSSEHFFLNREIDDAEIPETFENFPETNKIKPAEQFESSFSQATQGEVEINKVNTSNSIQSISTDPSDSNAVATDSFSSPETVVSPPEEDQIKTFMFEEKNLPASLLSEETDEYSVKPESKIQKMVANLKPTIKTWIQKPKSRKILFVTSAILLGVFVLFALEGDFLFHREPVNPETAINSEAGFQKLRRSEKKRVILFQIDQIRKLVHSREIIEADERMRKLMILASKDEDFVKFEKEYQHERELILIEENRKKQEQEEKEKKKQDLMAEAQEMIDDKQFDLAKKNYMHVLDLFPDDPDVQDKIQTLELMQEQEERQTFAKKQRFDMLNRIYTEGVQKYESGQPGLAQKLFKQVTTEKSHPKYKKSVEYLNKIENMTDKKLDQKIAAAKKLILSQDTLIQGYQDLKKISSQFPLRSDAKKAFSDAKVKMDKKARELYADALAQEELAGDPAAALDLYKEVLKYAPDPSNKYNQKSREKIEALQL